ncbi:MAG: hypothetical protein SP1CHLAM54_08450 [Chlamydiia bacterium]|nr:hypothetical protein [Chlamydiia bacterium]MCH9615751.1 hypothetical protein [Chlamydiia bacterium]MCH9628846.1 hypothetical protein [Chlamydiia bacterium]
MRLPMTWTRWIVYIYAALVLVGGIMGFAKAGSWPSLIAGVIFSVFIFFSRYRYQIVWIALLDLVFLYRLIVTMKFMPAGMMWLISTAVLLILYIASRRRAK